MPLRGRVLPNNRLLAALTVLVIVVAGGAAAGAAAGVGTALAIFTSTTAVPLNTFSTGTVALSDDDNGSAILTLANAYPGNSASGCIRVSYTGTIPVEVRLYGSVAGTGLGDYLDMTITRGSISSPSFPSCTTFTADSATYAAANGVMYSATLATFTSTHQDYSTGLADPTSVSPAGWTNGTTVAYKITVTLRNNSSAQGLTATPTLTWEAQQQQ